MTRNDGKQMETLPSHMDIILHIAERSDWEQAEASGSYRADTLASHGFIHCSTPEQVIHVVNAFFRGQEGLALLCIDTAKVEAEIRRENLEGGDERFLHIYGPLDVDAVISVLDFKPQPDGTFVLPEGLPSDRDAEQRPENSPR